MNPFNDIFPEEPNFFPQNKNPLLSPLNFTGSKSKLVPQIVKYLPPNQTTLYDLFTGGGSVIVNLLPYFSQIISNDIITPLINFYKLIQTTPYEILESSLSLKNIPKNDPQAYDNLRNSFNMSQDPIEFFVLTCSCTNNMMRFNKSLKFNQTYGKRNFNHKIKEKLKNYSNVLYLNNKITFLNQNFLSFNITKGFVYLDPPYLISEAGYNAFWSNTLEQSLYDFIDDLNKKNVPFMLSNIAEHKGKTNPYLHKLKPYRIINVNYNYDKTSRSGPSNTQEILVVNY